MKINELFFELSNEERFKIFKSLFNESKRHNQIEKELGIRGSEVSRHLKRLIKEDLVEKDIYNKYDITNIGRIFLQILDLLKIFLKFKNYFNSHNVYELPFYVTLQLGDLKTLKINKGTMQNIELWAQLIKDSEKFILAISDQFQDSILPIVEKKINNISINIRAIIDETVLKSKGYEKLEDRHAFYRKLNIAENIKVLTHIDFSLLVSDKGAIIFLKREGKIDYSECLYDDIETFINWAINLFEWYWKKGKDIKPFIKK
ncbi:MAG: ArsR family transcriptional regulator [Promethearchaeota archaeon]